MGHATTVIEFRKGKDEFFEIVRAWALASDFAIYEKDDNYKLYWQKISTGAMWLSAKHDGQKARLEAWLASGQKPDFEGNFWVGYKEALPKRLGRMPHMLFKDNFNKLLDLLEEPRI